MQDVEKLTGDEIESMVAEMRANDDGTGWVVSERPVAYRMMIMPQLYLDMSERADELGMTHDEFISSAIAHELATA